MDDSKKTAAGKPAVPEVIVYTTPSCRYCAMAKSYLADRGVKFIEFDVSRDRARAREMYEKSGQLGVPVLQVNGRIIVGFNRELIDDALSKPKPIPRDAFVQNVIFDPFED